MNIGIVGQGFVGSAIWKGLKTFHDIETYDINSAISSCNSLKEVVDYGHIIFVCLPTPMKLSTGECDIDLVQQTVLTIDKLAETNKIVVIKSTVPPGTTAVLDRQTKIVDVIFNPEFLTEANSFEDFKNQTRIIIGGSRPATSVVKTMFRKAFPTVPIVKTGSRTAEMVKYFTNCFLATKVTFANELYQICKTLEVDYDKVVEYSLYDERIGRTHLAVPGPDGDFGFGGHCFPKDLAALKYVANQHLIDTTILHAVETKNRMVRTNEDWMGMIGRAVSEEK